mmetsp:Transcript_29404/g.83716  ORF Transcript_29404/g.83716 Transcript_29404/m.83716 type:complete len:428 (-) Transcript_29404:177-1460(-)
MSARGATRTTVVHAVVLATIAEALRGRYGTGSGLQSETVAQRFSPSAALWPFAAAPALRDPSGKVPNDLLAFDSAAGSLREDIGKLLQGKHLENQLPVEPAGVVDLPPPPDFLGAAEGDAIVLWEDFEVCLQCLGGDVSGALLLYSLFDKSMRALKNTVSEMEARAHVLMAGEQDALVVEAVRDLVRAQAAQGDRERCLGAEEARRRVVDELGRGAQMLRAGNSAIVDAFSMQADGSVAPIMTSGRFAQVGSIATQGGAAFMRTLPTRPLGDFADQFPGLVSRAFKGYSPNPLINNVVIAIRGAMGIKGAEKQMAYLCGIFEKLPLCKEVIGREVRYLSDFINGHLATIALLDYFADISQNSLAMLDPERHLQATSSLLTVLLIKQKYLTAKHNHSAVEPVTQVHHGDVIDTTAVEDFDDALALPSS